MSLFFIRFMLRTKKIMVTTLIHRMLRIIIVSGPRFRRGSTLPRRNPRVRFTTCVSGRTARAAV